jgi:hypothetical protein
MGASKPSHQQQNWNSADTSNNTTEFDSTLVIMVVSNFLQSSQQWILGKSIEKTALSMPNLQNSNGWKDWLQTLSPILQTLTLTERDDTYLKETETEAVFSQRTIVWEGDFAPSTDITVTFHMT